MENLRKKIVNRLKTLQDIDGVDVEISEEGKTVYIRHETYHSPAFKFKWNNDHFTGYFLDADGNRSQAVISIWAPIEAIHFVTAYSILIDLRANREKNS